MTRKDSDLYIADHELKSLGIDVGLFRKSVQQSGSGDDLGTLQVLQDPAW